MQQGSFGNILSNERRKLGLTIEQAAASTRIRPKFLIAFEKEDFEHMPPLGYAQNMLTSYARFLDLNPAPIVESMRRDYIEYDLNPTDIARELSNTSVGDTHSKNPASRREHSATRGTRSANTDAYLGRNYGRSRQNRTSQQRESNQERTNRHNQMNARRLADSRAGYNRDDQRRTKSGSSSYNAYKEQPPGVNKKIIILAILAILFIALVIWGISSCASRKAATSTSAKPNTGDRKSVV